MHCQARLTPSCDVTQQQVGVPVSVLNNSDDITCFIPSLSAFDNFIAPNF